MFGVHTANGNVHTDILLLGMIALEHSKQFSVGLMVLSDGLVYFLKIENFFCRIHQNYLVALIFSFKMHCTLLVVNKRKKKKKIISTFMHNFTVDVIYLYS